MYISVSTEKCMFPVSKMVATMYAETTDFAANLHRLMARFGLNVEEVVERTGLDERTVKGILSGSSRRPHARTLHKLATGLGVSADELFQNPSLLAHRRFDRTTNPFVEEVISERPELFGGWGEREFDELYSRFGTGGALTVEGTLDVVEAMNRKREIHRKVELVMETDQAELLNQVVCVLYKRIALSPSEGREPEVSTR